MVKTLNQYTFAITIATLNLAFVFPAFAQVLTPDLTYGGKTQYEWSADWWKTFLEAPYLGNPLLFSDSDSAKLEAINNPSSPVFFLTGSLDSSQIDRRVTISGNRAIFFPVYNAFNADPDIPPSELCSNISMVAPVTGNSLFATLDGSPIPIDGNLNPRRQNCSDQPNSGGFVVNELPDSLLQFLAEDDQTLSYNFVSDGYWVLLTPLTSGEHTITFGATDSQGNTLQDNTYRITVLPVPEPTSTLSILTLGTLGTASSLKRKLKTSKSK